MATNTGNIIVGAAALAVGTVAGTVPATFYTDGIYNTTKNVVTGTPKDWRGFVQGLTSAGTTVTLTGGATVKWRDAGLTQEGVEVTYSPEYGEVEVDQARGGVGSDGHRVHVPAAHVAALGAQPRTR